MDYLIEYDYLGETHREHFTPTREFRLRDRVQFVRDVCACPLRLYRMKRGQWVRVRCRVPRWGSQ